MGQRQEYLNKIISDIDNSVCSVNVPDFPTTEFHNEIKNVYRSLGGILPEYPSRLGAFDIARATFVIELDEERHFNRYRERTLNSSIYKNFNRFDVLTYRDYCKYQESNCFKAARHGGYWENDSTEKQFGMSDLNGTIIKMGSSRWKQRAFYDYLKDVMGIITGFPIIRISIYDMVSKEENFDSCLRNYKKKEVLKFLKQILLLG